MLRIKLFIFSLLCAGLFFTSCEEDPTGPGTGGGSVNAPFADLLDEFGGTFTGGTFTPGATFRVTVDATSNVAQLSAIAVARDGFNLGVDEFDNIDLADADEQNPQLLFGTDKDFVNYTFELTAPDTEGSYLFEFTVTDDDQLQTVSSFTIDVEGVPTPATIELMSPSTIESPAGSLIKVNVLATAGSLDMESISVWEDGSLITDVSRLRFNDGTWAENPLPLADADRQSLEAGVTVVTMPGDHTYVVRITDTAGTTSDVSFEIIEIMTGTALENVFSFVLVSNASGQGLGGLDIEDGVAVSSSSADAEIRDLGIDLGQPASSNWIQQVEAVNGSELRVVDLAQLPEDFSFASVTFKEQIATAYNTALPVTTSPVLQAGDLLAVGNPDNLYLIEVESVNVTTGDNNDNYEFNIKF